MSKRLIALIMGALAVGLIAGCGSSNSDSSGSITKTAFIKQADAICVKTREGIETEFEAVLRKLGGLKGSKAPGAYAAAAETILIPGLKREVGGGGSAFPAVTKRRSTQFWMKPRKEPKNSNQTPLFPRSVRRRSKPPTNCRTNTASRVRPELGPADILADWPAPLYAGRPMDLTLSPSEESSAKRCAPG